MKALLIYPEYPETFWSFKHALKFISKKAAFPPLGLLTVASILPKDWQKRLCDMNVEKLSDEDILWADYIFIGAIDIQKRSAIEVLKRAKNLGTKTVCGGPLFTTSPREFETLASHLVLNEAEITLPQFLKDLKENSEKKVYETQKFCDMEKTPVPLWEICDLGKYASASIQYSRGCPFNCEFCDIITLYGNKQRTKNIAQIISELELLYRLGWKGSVFFVDDNFIGNRRKLKREILPYIIKWMEKRSYPFTFYTEASINLADDEELMDLMVKAGFNRVFVGIETPNEESLSECGKFQNKGRDLVYSVKKIQANGLEVQGGFIVGFDNDPPSIFERQIKFIQKSGIVTAMVGLLNAPRGTKLYKRLASENRLIKEATGDNTDFSINFIPKMNYDTLIKGYKKIVSTIYSPPFYYERIKTFLRNYNLKMKNFGRIKSEDIKALFKSIWILGIKGKERFYYWRLFIWTVLKKPKLFPLFVNFAICGFHFRKVFEKHKS